MNAKTGLQAHTVSIVAQAALGRLWLQEEVVCHVSVMDMVTHSEATVITRQASVTVQTTPRARTVRPACLVTMETP